MAFCLSLRRKDHMWNWAHVQSNPIRVSVTQTTSITHTRTPQGTNKQKKTRNTRKSRDGCGGIYEQTWLGGRNQFDHTPFPLQGHCSPLPRHPTGSATSEPRWRTKKEQRTRVMAVNSRRSDWISSEMEVEIEAWKQCVDWWCMLLKRIWNFLSISLFFLCLSLFSVSFRLFFLSFSRQQPYIRVQTQGKWRALPLCSVLEMSTNPTNLTPQMTEIFFPCP